MAINVQCPSCGKHWQVHEADGGRQARCPDCQSPMSIPATAFGQTGAAAGEVEVMPPARTCGLATAALVLGILPLCITNIVGIILAIVALSKISSSQGRLKGNGFAIAGIVISVVYVVMLPVVAVLAGIMLPALAHAREEARKAVCKSNLKQIGLAIAMYSNDYDNWPPAGQATDADNLAILYDQYITATKIFRCPSRPVGRVHAPPSASGRTAPVAGRCDYEYVTLGRNAPPDTIIAADKPENHGDIGRNVLFFDGSVRWIPEKEFQAMLEAQRDRRIPPTGPPPDTE